MAVDTVHPWKATLTISSNVSASTSLVAELREFEVVVAANFIDATSNDSSGWREMAATRNPRVAHYDWSISGTAVFKPATVVNATKLLSNLNNASGNAASATQVVLTLRDVSTTTARLLRGNMLLENYEVGSEYDSLVLHDFTLRGVGPISAVTLS